MNLRIRMKSAMLLLIMLCILCVNSVLAKEEGALAAKDAKESGVTVCYTAEELPEAQ